jgi:drug/metabolite transporter (DMT)-like permease
VARSTFEQYVIGAEWMSAACGLASAGSWGGGDFCGGLATRDTGVFPAVIGSQLFGVLILTGAAVALGDRAPTIDNVMWSAAAGLCGAAGLLALYRALSEGRMGLAAPVSGVLSAAVPVVAGGVLEGMPGRLRLAGFALALVGVWLVASSEYAVFRFRELGLPVTAGVGFGGFIVLIGRASGGGVFWPLVAARVASLSLLMLVAIVARQRVLPARQHLTLVFLSGLGDAAGNVFLVLAAHSGRLDVAGVLSSLYPASTVLLAWLILHERFTGQQFLGILAALSAIVIITAR